MTTFAEPPAPVSQEAQERTAELRRDIEVIFPDPEAWLQTVHPLLGRKPGEMLGNYDEEVLWDLIGAIKYGFPT